VDTYISDVNPTTNYGTAAVLYVGELNVGANILRTLIKFDLSSIPSGALINSATLSFYTTGDYSDTDRTWAARRLKRDWVEAQATWNIYSTGNDWSTAGATHTDDSDLTNMGEATVANNLVNGSEIQFALTASEVQKMIDGTYANYGWLIKIKGAELNDSYELGSSGNGTSGLRPKLVIEYSYGGNVIFWDSD
jgi:hypothetical protein